MKINVYKHTIFGNLILLRYATVRTIQIKKLNSCKHDHYNKKIVYSLYKFVSTSFLSILLSLFLSFLLLFLLIYLSFHFLYYRCISKFLLYVSLSFPPPPSPHIYFLIYTTLYIVCFHLKFTGNNYMLL